MGKVCVRSFVMTIKVVLGPNTVINTNTNVGPGTAWQYLVIRRTR